MCESNVCRTCILRNGNDECGVLQDTSGDYYDNLKEWCLKEENNPRIILN